MIIVNTFPKWDIPILRTYDLTNPTLEYQPKDIGTSAMLALQNYEPTEFGWYCMITTSDSLQIFDIKKLMDEKVYQAIVNGSCKLIIDSSFEPFYSCIDSTYINLVVKYNIPAQQILFITNMYDAASYNNNIYKNYSETPIKILYFAALEFMISNNKKKFVSNTLEIKNYNKKFINLNRRWRIHRPLLTSLFYAENILKDGYVSLGFTGEDKTFENWNIMYDGLIVSCASNQTMLEMVLKAKKFGDILPLHIDTSELNINWVVNSDSIIPFYENTYFSVISETTFFNKDLMFNSRFLTEKTFKAIELCHPFVLVTIPKSLEVLKSMGYKTFSPWIDESYDQELDDYARMLKIINEVKRLCNLDVTQLEEFLINCKQICNYNLEILKTKSNFIYPIDAF